MKKLVLAVFLISLFSYNQIKYNENYRPYYQEVFEVKESK